MYCDIDNVLRGRKMKRLIEQFYSNIKAKYDLKQIEIDIMYYIYQKQDKVTVTKVSSDLLLNKGQVSKAMFTLCEKKYLTESNDINDRRKTYYRLSPPADRIVAEIEHNNLILMNGLFEGVSDEDMKEMERIIKILFSNMDKMTGNYV